MPQFKGAADRLGVFKTIGDVPNSRRFHQYTAAYEGQDTWEDYRATVELSETMSTEWACFIRRWKAIWMNAAATTRSPRPRTSKRGPKTS